MRAIEQRPLLWEKLTWEDAGSLRDAGVNVCLLPVGATEQHGPHLGTGMDSVNATMLCQAVSRETGAPVLPTLSYGCSLGHSRRWPGTLSLQPQTLMDVIVQIFDWLYGAGFKRLIIVNGHVGNAAPLRCAVDLIRSRWDDSTGRRRKWYEITKPGLARLDRQAIQWRAYAECIRELLDAAPGIRPATA